MTDFGKILVVLGLAMAVAGAVLWSGIGRSWIGRLPGDLHFRKGTTEIYFPLATCLLVSAVLTLISYLLRARR